jgi:uncharacterized Zn-binding protein involved in type VI secretion
MPTDILVNGLGLTYKTTVGVSVATLPDVCKTPSPGGPVPIPYPNFADQSSLDKGSKTVKAKGKMIAIKGSEYSMSSGDEPGTVGGVTSNTFKKETSWITYSFDVKIDGGNACRHTDKLFHNHKNAANLAGNLDPAVAAAAEKDILCAIVKCDTKDENNQDYDVSKTTDQRKMPFGSQCSALGSKKHSCVKRTLEKKNANCQCEKTFDMRPPPPAPPVPSSPPLPAGAGRRPDVVVGGPPPADYDVYDAKFPCSPAVKNGQMTGPMPSDPTRSGASMMSVPQHTAYKRIANGGKVSPLSPEDCKAKLKQNNQTCDD